MKKVIVIALAVIMMISAVAVLAACAKTGEYSYPNAWTEGQTYGCQVKVSVKDGKISKLVVKEDSDTYYNVSSGWESKKTWEDGRQALYDSFIGLSVEDVLKIKVDVNGDGESPVGQPKSISNVPAGLKVVTGATQSSGRLILAVQDALK